MNWSRFASYVTQVEVFIVIRYQWCGVGTRLNYRANSWGKLVLYEPNLGALSQGITKLVNHYSGLTRQNGSAAKKNSIGYANDASSWRSRYWFQSAQMNTKEVSRFNLLLTMSASKVAVTTATKSFNRFQTSFSHVLCCGYARATTVMKWAEVFVQRCVL